MLDGFTSFAPGLSEVAESYDAARYATIAAVERTHFWFRGRNDLIVWALGKYFPNARSLLEVGCGTGQVLESIQTIRPGLRLVGTEIHVRGLGFSRRRLPETEFLQMDARAIPFADEFDVVCAFDVIEHVEEDATVLAQLYQACRPGGGLLLTVPQHRWLWSYKDKFAHHQRRYCRRELEEKVVDAGFRVVRASSFVSLLLPLMYVSRVLEREPAQFNSQREFDIRPTLNQVFLALMRAEATLIRRGVSLPAGGSLLLVAQKT
ncbi:MAG: class I SAM-dependent methyltransferase [Thermodesulfobacteriota bacterium]